MQSKDVDQYLAGFEGQTKLRLIKLRSMAHQQIPGAFEKISYGVPTICDANGKYIAYFAGYKDFVSVYPVHLAETIKGLEKHLSGRSTARFKNSEPLPEPIIEQIFKNLLDSYTERKNKNNR